MRLKTRPRGSFYGSSAQGGRHYHNHRLCQHPKSLSIFFHKHNNSSKLFDFLIDTMRLDVMGSEKTMNHFRTSSKGFTGREFLIVMSVIFLLCVVSVPAFYALQRATRVHNMNQIVLSVQRELPHLATTIYENLPSPVTTYPESLDHQPSQRRCFTCFNKVLKKGINNVFWFKLSDTEYLFSTNGNSGDVSRYQEKGDYRIQYRCCGESSTVEVEEIR